MKTKNKKPKRLRQHVNPLKMTSLVPREPLDLPAGPEVEVELGCGDARFIIERAQCDPDGLYVGLDIREEFLALGRAAVEQLQLDNVVLDLSNLIVDAEHLFSAGRIRRFHINFPDPWFKARQHNRRWLSEQTLPHLVTALQRRGEIFFQSDVWDVALEALSLLEADDRLENAAGAWSFTRTNPFEAQSSRELACQEAGLPIWRLLFVRLPDDEDEEEEYD
jgi:tRNA (guanine-N7-)-methyltransferase